MDIRLGNDIPISWEITRKGIPEDLTGKKLTLMMHVALQTFVIKDFIVQGNTVKWIFSGKDQTTPGQYRFTLIANDGQKNMFTVDACSALTLTLSSCCESSEAGSEVSIRSDIMIPSNGLSAYEIAVKYGYQGTEEEWLASITKPAEDAMEAAKSADNATKFATEATEKANKAASLANSAAQKAESTNTSVAEAEAARKKEWTELKESVGTETQKASAAAQEASAAAQEASAAAQKADDAAATALSSAEVADAAAQLAAQTEIAVKEAEQGRVKAEQARVTAEQQRVNEFAILKQESETATKNAEDAAEKANQAAENIDNKQDKTDDTLHTTSKEITGAINEVKQTADSAQPKSDNILQTDAKTVVGAINEVKESNDFLNRNLGEYGTAISLPMTVGMFGKYIDTDGQEQSNPSMGISAPVSILAGNIYLLQCGAALGTGVSVFSRKVTNTYDKVIDYSYTYNEDGTIATATADYDPSLVYTYSHDEESHATITDNEGEIVQELPATHNVTESFYEPLFRTNDSTMPESGYYLLLCTQDMEMVVSAASADITGKNLLSVRYGVFASIATNFVGTPGQKVIAQAFAELYAAVQALSSVTDNAGRLKVEMLDMANLPKVCGEDMFITGEGAPATPPTVPFQEYYDKTNSKFYKAKGVLPDTPSVGDWIAIN